jgi:hypothetical protein
MCVTVSIPALSLSLNVVVMSSGWIRKTRRIPSDERSDLVYDSDPGQTTQSGALQKVEETTIAESIKE